MFNSLTKYFFSSNNSRENSNENETEETKCDKLSDQDGWVIVVKPSEYYGDYEDNAEDDDNDRGYSPIRSSNLINENGETCHHDGFLIPPSPRRAESPKTNGHISRSRHPSGSPLWASTQSGDEFDQKGNISSDELQQQHSDFERYRGPYWNILDDEEQEIKKEGGVLSSASSQPEIVNIPSHEEHWILSPAPCFGGKPETCLKGSMEDLLIERPTTSIYLKFMGKKNGIDKANGLSKNLTLNSKDISLQAGRTSEADQSIKASAGFQNFFEKNGFESFDSRLVTYDAIYPQKNSKYDQRDNDGWSSESSTRDHSLSRPPIRSFAARHENRNLQPEESSEMSEGTTRLGHDPYDDFCTSKFLLPFEDDETRARGKRKLLPKHQRSQARMRFWQKPRKTSTGGQMNGCK